MLTIKLVSMITKFRQSGERHLTCQIIYVATLVERHESKILWEPMCDKITEAVCSLFPSCLASLVFDYLRVLGDPGQFSDFGTPGDEEREKTPAERPDRPLVQFVVKPLKCFVFQDLCALETYTIVPSCSYPTENSLFAVLGRLGHKYLEKRDRNADSLRD
jgi:hypothetical protein